MKPTVAFFDFSSCEGCQIELTNFGDTIFLELLEHIEIVEFREAMQEKSDSYDIAFIEGSFTREVDRKRIEDIRKKAGVVIAYGACATNGGINALRNHQTDYKEYVYGKSANLPHLNSSLAKPISEVIQVDYFVPGCPIDKNEFAKIVTDLLHGKEPFIPDYPVCVECKRRETLCRFDDNDYCLGMVTRAGCNAPCPADGIPCEACRGFVTEYNKESLEKVLFKKGNLSKKIAESKTRMFTANLRDDSL